MPRALKPCVAPAERNPETNRCKKPAVKREPKPCKDYQQRAPSGRCVGRKKAGVAKKTPPPVPPRPVKKVPPPVPPKKKVSLLALMPPEDEPEDEPERERPSEEEMREFREQSAKRFAKQSAKDIAMRDAEYKIEAYMGTHNDIKEQEKAIKKLVKEGKPVDKKASKIMADKKKVLKLEGLLILSMMNMKHPEKKTYKAIYDIISTIVS